MHPAPQFIIEPQTRAKEQITGKDNYSYRAYMEDYANKSCWGITAWAVAAFGIILLVTAMFGHVDTTTVLTAGVTG